ncbi:arginine-ornithine antiporter [Rhodoferax sp.]|uniref:arginine-ornithine antiporter n=1 Tax=Rhodoferax sp. TaxID=50421 RepID=UPI003784306D
MPAEPSAPSPAVALKVPQAPNTPARLGLGLLVALVVGSVLGSGIFGLPQNMARGAGAGAVLIAWCISGFGMLMLALTYQMLALRQPLLNNGVFAYARALSGDYVGFNSAWGYWVSAWIGNVGYLVAAFSALGYFFPAFGDGNTPAATVGASVVLWLVHFMVLRGIKGAAVLNGMVTVAKVVPLLVFIAVLVVAFQASTFSLDFWGNAALPPVLEQVKSTMLVTVWVFIGIEGASVYSSRAKRRADVGRATVIGYGICLALLMAVSLLSMGVLSQPQLAGLKNPSMAPVLEQVVGHWGAVLVYVGLILSVGGGLLAWTLLAAESLFSPANEGVMPRWLTRQNPHGVPANALWLTNGMVQVFLLITLFSNASYLALISLSTAMILLPYLWSAAFALRTAWRGEGSLPAGSSQHRAADLPVAALACVYCVWLLYAAGLQYVLLSAVLYAPGAALYYGARRGLTKPAFTSAEKIALAALVLLAVVAVAMLGNGSLAL